MAGQFPHYQRDSILFLTNLSHKLIDLPVHLIRLFEKYHVARVRDNRQARTGIFSAMNREYFSGVMMSLSPQMTRTGTRISGSRSITSNRSQQRKSFRWRLTGNEQVASSTLSRTLSSTPPYMVIASPGTRKGAYRCYPRASSEKRD